MEAKHIESMAMARYLLAGKVIAFHSTIAKITNDVKATLFFCQLMYWSDKGDDERGWIWKTRQEWTEETTLSRREQETARGRLRKLDLIEEHRRGLPAQLYYRVKWEQLAELLQAQADAKATSKAETYQLVQDGTKPPSELAQNVPTGRHETAQHSTEITTEITTDTYPPGMFTWLDHCREIGGWSERGEPHVIPLVKWVERKGYTEEELEDAAIGMKGQQAKGLKGAANLASKFQVAVNKGYYRDRRNTFQQNGSAPSGHNDDMMNRIKVRKAASNVE